MKGWGVNPTRYRVVSGITLDATEGGRAAYVAVTRSPSDEAGVRKVQAVVDAALCR
ncbi:hypothetical protein ACIG5E_13005 [Kitasatospora sp. NPDC053057]|uniref:hypothetical protein n=1 Tax=Kitasatospora sp. NPDC053057 TaxID=3364062 RepID=UPI0037CAE19D